MENTTYRIAVWKHGPLEILRVTDDEGNLGWSVWTDKRVPKTIGEKWEQMFVFHTVSCDDCKSMICNAIREDMRLWVDLYLMQEGK